MNNFIFLKNFIDNSKFMNNLRKKSEILLFLAILAIAILYIIFSCKKTIFFLVLSIVFFKIDLKLYSFVSAAFSSYFVFFADNKRITKEIEEAKNTDNK